MGTTGRTAGIALVTSLVAGCGSASQSPSSSVPTSEARVGAFHGDHCNVFLGGCTNETARKALRGSEVWCAWRDDHVVVHVVLGNRLNAHVTARISPSFKVDHGVAIGPARPVHIAARSRVSAIIDWGKPEDIKTGAEIAECYPELFDIDITDPIPNDDDRVEVTSLGPAE
jgi:hypothetical protein